MNQNDELIKLLNTELSLALPWKIKMEEIRNELSTHIHSLINENFQKLVTILYRVDVSEDKLKALLKDQPGQDAGDLIADLIIERQLQKIKSRKEFRQGEKDIDEGDKW